MAGKIAPSMMCTDLMNVQRDIRVLEEAGVDYLHVDIMDNHFVPNITLSPDFVKAMKKITKVPLDIHLMVENPETSIPLYAQCEQDDILCVHYEATLHVQRALALIKKMGVKAGVALNPGTPLCMIEDLLPDLDMILIMTVNPGFAGQTLVPATLDKIRRLRKILTDKNFGHVMIEVDGNVSFKNAKIMRECGADIFVGGSSSVFEKSHSILENCRKMREVI